MVKKLNSKLKIIAIIAFMVAMRLCNAQQLYVTSITVKMDGYFIILGKNIFIFQPTDSMSLLSSLNNTSFGLGNNNGQRINYLLEESIQGLGDSIDVRIRQNSDSTIYEDQLRYFYCTIEFSLSLWGKDNHLDMKPARSLFYKGKWYDVECNFIRNRTLKIIPKGQKDLGHYKENYMTLTGDIPEYLR